MPIVAAAGTATLAAAAARKVTCFLNQFEVIFSSRNVEK